MRLLHTAKLKLEQFSSNSIPPYTILSHTWGENEVTFQGLQRGFAEEMAGFEKIRGTCAIAATCGYDYVWIDTCCIDKTSSAELSEAINSMFHWYREADVCFAHLVDVPSLESRVLLSVSSREVTWEMPLLHKGCPGHRNVRLRGLKTLPILY